MKPADVWSSLELAEKIRETHFKDAALKVLCDHAAELLRAPSFLDVPHSTLVTVVQQDQLNVSCETEVIEACLRWAARECGRRHLEVHDRNLRVVMGPQVVAGLRLLSLSPQQFASGPGARDWLSGDEKASVYQSFHASSSKLCKGLCASKEPREKSKVLAACSSDDSTKFHIVSLPETCNKVDTFMPFSDYNIYQVEMNVNEEEACISSIDIFSQVRNQEMEKSNNFHITGISNMYSEQVDVYICQQGGNVCTKFKREVAYDSHFTVKFDRPVPIRFRKCIIKIRFIKSGIYPVIKVPQLSLRTNKFHVSFEQSWDPRKPLAISIKGITFVTESE